MPIDPLMTIGTLRDQHLDLMQAWRGLTDEADKLARAKEMRRTAVEAGRSIEAPLERDEAQGIVDYWASAIAGLPGETYPELLSIEAYSGVQARDAGLSVREAYEALQPQEAQRMARSILLDLLTLGANGVERDLPRSRQALQKSAGTSDTNMFDAALATLVKSGAIVRRASESRADDYFEAVDGRIAESWPALKEWLLAAKTYGVDRGQMMDRAQRWCDANKPRDLLLNSGEVETALSFKGEDELLDEYIERSRTARRRVRQAVVGFLVCAVIFLLGALSWSIHLTNRAEAQRREEMLEKMQIKLELATAKRDQAYANLANARSRANAITIEVPGQLALRDRQRIGPGSGVPDNPEATQALRQIGILTGYIWLGSDAAPQVSTLQGADATGLAQAAPETRFRTRRPIYLRAGLPAAATYAPAPWRAVVPAGTQIVLLQTPTGFNRDTGRQYWAQVRVVPQVYIQYNNANATSTMVERMRRQFAAAGFEVPAAESRDDFTGSEVRYFKEEDSPIAALLQQMLRRPELGGRYDVKCRFFTNSSSVAPNFRLEIWYAPSRLQSDQEAAPCS